MNSRAAKRAISEEEAPRSALRGANPYQRLRYFSRNPGHFREYTGEELRAMAPTAALQCERIEWIDFYRGGRQRLWPRLRDSLIGVYEKARP